MSVLTIRRWHSYIGLLIAPSVLFFALTGALQLFSLHEAHGEYKPPTIIEKLSSVHKDQVFALGDHHDGPPGREGPPGHEGSAEHLGPPPGREGPAPKSEVGKEPPAGAEHEGDEPKLPTFILKMFFLVVALGLTVSASLGLYIGLTQTRDRLTARLLVFAGTLIPIVLLFF